MTSFETLAQKRRELVRAHRENNFEAGIRSLLSDLYPDDAHFIYELLQNAEDVGATQVDFVLDDAQLVVKHNGSRPFSIEDITYITNIGENTKATDETTIGKFGVGFKAVFGYTKSPQVRSGEFSFVIEDLWVPVRINGQAPAGVTEFTFPFNEPKKPPKLAVAEISKALAALDASTLLFLNHIERIAFRLPTGSGSLERISDGQHRIRIRASVNNEIQEDHWYRLRDTVQIDTDDGAKEVTVAAAFHLSPIVEADTGKAESAVRAPSLRIRPMPEGRVCIYFPAVKETSGLRFNIHGPFASTVARDSVRDDPANVQLVQAIAQMVAGSLTGLRDEGLLGDGLLEALPNPQDQIPILYSPIREAVINAFRDEELTPVYGGAGHARARDLVSSPQAFRGALDLQGLAFLAERVFGPQNPQYRWVVDRTGRARQFLTGLGIREFGWGELSKALALLEADYHQQPVAMYLTNSQPYSVIPFTFQPAGQEAWTAWGQWLAAASVEKLRALYGLLQEAVQSRQMHANLQRVPIIRRDSPHTAEHVLGQDVYLPQQPSDRGSRYVPWELVHAADDKESDQLRRFYETVGVRPWDDEADLLRRLRQYEDEDVESPEDGTHFDDLRFFTSYLEKNPDAIERFAGVSLVKASDSDGIIWWCTPDEVFIDEPFLHTGLASLTGSPEFREYRLWHGYLGGFPDVVDLLIPLGSSVGLRIRPISARGNSSFQEAWVVNANKSRYTRDVDYTVPYFRNAVQAGDVRLMRQLWTLVQGADSALANAMYQFNSNHPERHFPSTVHNLLTTVPWVLDRDGNTRLPAEVGAEDLPDDFDLPPILEGTLLQAVGFGRIDAEHGQLSTEADEVARGLGIPPETAQKLREVMAGRSPEEVDDWIEELKQHRSPFPQIGETAPNPDLRRERAGQIAAAEPTRTFGERTRRVEERRAEAIAQAKAYLRAQYATAEGKVHCQVCRSPMPFQVKGTDYFEAVELLRKKDKLHHQNRLALCPVCAAKYRHANETDMAMLGMEILTSPIEPTSLTLEFELTLAGKSESLLLTAKHAIDLQGAMGQEGFDPSSSIEKWSLEAET